jgi:hypothetical protein
LVGLVAVLVVVKLAVLIPLHLMGVEAELLEL